MKTKAVLFLLFTVTLFALATFISVLFNTSPTTTGVIILFYISLILTTFGLLFFAIYFVNYIKYHAVLPWQTTLAALRISFITSLVVAALLAVRSVHLLNIATFLVLLALGIIAEVASSRYIVKIKAPKSRDIHI